MSRADLRSPTYLAWVRSLPCYFGDDNCLGDTQAHHFPPKGQLGYTDDLSTLPACILEHKRCHGETVMVNGARCPPIGFAQQHMAALVTLFRFWHEAPADVRQAVCDEIRDHEQPKSRKVVPW